MAESVRYQVEADIASASTLDAGFYNDEAAFHALGGMPQM
jgi:hypothetical protein